MEKSKISLHQVVTWAVIIILLVLRLGLFGWVRYKYPTLSIWINPVYEIATYGLIVLLIGWEWKYIKQYHFNPLSILILIIFRPLSILIGRIFDQKSLFDSSVIWYLSFFIIAAILLFIAVRNKLDFKAGIRKDLICFLLCAFLGILFFSTEGILMIRYLGFPQKLFPGWSALLSPVYQLGFAAVPEEPLFRGFLWGGLRKLGLKDFWILIIQALLFLVGHIYYLNTDHGLFFLGFVFIDALLMGLLVWKSRTLSTSMAFHGFANGSAIFQYWIYSLVLR